MDYRSNKQNPDKIAYTPIEVARFLGMSLNGVYNAIEAGHLPAVRVGRNHLIPKDRLMALLAGDNEPLAKTA